MIERIQEEVGVITVYTPGKAYPLPYRVKWNHRDYKIDKVDLCHPVWEGKTLHHIYSVCDGTTFMRLNFNTRSQHWVLEEISDGLGS